MTSKDNILTTTNDDNITRRKMTFSERLHFMKMTKACLVSQSGTGPGLFRGICPLSETLIVDVD